MSGFQWGKITLISMSTTSTSSLSWAFFTGEKTDRRQGRKVRNQRFVLA